MHRLRDESYSEDLLELHEENMAAAPADLVEVVRCKDCKHNPEKAWFGCPMAGNDRRGDDDFCSMAVRREDG